MLWKYYYIIIVVWELLLDAIGILLFYHGTIVIIAKHHGNITILSWESRKNYHKGLGETTKKRY
jgi:hypothetical protein